MTLPKMLVRTLVFDSEGYILLLRRADTRRGVWELPGGGVSEGEAPSIAAARELAEETSLQDPQMEGVIAKGMVRGLGKRKLPWRAYRARCVSRRVSVNPKEHDNAGWFEITKLPENIDPVSAEIIRRTT
jgi:ADP-ribose pyrophosphatase YjhB (NUDIX family)